jgi:hypothetical protein
MLQLIGKLLIHPARLNMLIKQRACLKKPNRLMCLKKS